MIPTRLLLIVGLLTVSHGTPRNQKKLPQEDQLDPKLVRLLLSNDFESGSMNPWYDESPGKTHWVLENLDSPQEPTPVPTPASGKSYARIDRPEGYTSGLAVLYTPFWTANPGDKLSLSFWIRSRHTQGNTLDVYWINGTKEEILLELSSFSTPSNNQWMTAEATIPVSRPTNTKLVIYGYCGPNEEDSIAIDNIVVESEVPTTPTTTPTTTTTTRATTAGTTTSPVPSTTVNPNTCRYELTNSTGSMRPPVGSDGVYFTNENCSWLISAPSYHKTIKLSFSNFFTELYYDIVKVYDGPTTSSRLLLNHSGSVVPFPLFASSNKMLVTFTSDDRFSYSGFTADYEGHKEGIRTSFKS